MILDYIVIFIKVISAHLRFQFKIRSSDPKKYYSALHLFSKQSFRLPESAKKDLLIILKVYWRVVKELWHPFEVRELTPGNVAVFDSNFKAQNSRLQYLNNFGVKPNYFLSREDLLGSPDFFAALIHLFFISLLCLIFLPFSFSARRVNYAILIREMVEWMNILHTAKKYQIKKFYHFCIYEKDANFLTCILNKKGIHVSKITSEVPLCFANRIIIANEICLCFAYQVEEIEAFKDTMFYERLQVWIPEMQITYLDKYKNKTFETPKNTIGFYSSAFWLRKKLNHSIADVGSYDVEEKLLDHVIEYLKQDLTIKLIVFPHPYERRNEENIKMADQHYANVFGRDLLSRVEFVKDNSRSTETFNKVNIGLSVFSTIVFERLSLGFKTILAPMDNKDFPLAGSPFRNICVYSKEELFRSIDNNLALSKEQFFETNGISSYLSKGVDLNYHLK